MVKNFTFIIAFNQIVPSVSKSLKIHFFSDRSRFLLSLRVTSPTVTSLYQRYWWASYKSSIHQLVVPWASLIISFTLILAQLNSLWLLSSKIWIKLISIKYYWILKGYFLFCSFPIYFQTPTIIFNFTVEYTSVNHIFQVLPHFRSMQIHWIL